MFLHQKSALTNRLKSKAKAEVDNGLNERLDGVLAEFHYLFINIPSDEHTTLTASYDEFNGIRDQIVLVASEIASRKKIASWRNIVYERLDKLLQREDVSFSVLPFGMFFRDDIGLDDLEKNARNSIVPEYVDKNLIAAGIVVGAVACSSYRDLGRQTPASEVLLIISNQHLRAA